MLVDVIARRPLARSSVPAPVSAAKDSSVPFTSSVAPASTATAPPSGSTRSAPASARMTARICGMLNGLSNTFTSSRQPLNGAPGAVDFPPR